jgi:hypothetical protein
MAVAGVFQLLWWIISKIFVCSAPEGGKLDWDMELG